MNTLTNQLAAMSPLQVALVAQKLAPQLALLNAEPIAIVGMGCRFPGASDPESLWQLMINKRNAVTEVPPTRWDINAIYDADPEARGKTNLRHGGFLEQIETFDPLFFDIAPREAMTMDPQHRLLLEVSWEALEYAGMVPARLFNSATGVFVGIQWPEYHELCARGDSDIYQRNEYLAHFGIGTQLCVAAGRISYLLGLHGPNLALDTACSSSLVAVHLACQSLHQRECNLALAGGVCLTLTHETHIFGTKTHMMSPDGRCKSFDASANGYIRSDGCGIVVLKRLADAIADGDNVLALIRGSAINNDGRSSGLTAPNGSAQKAVIRRALENAGVDPLQINYIEAHGTGTVLGDPIEADALGAVYGKNRTTPLLIGSVKSNIGHTEAAAGVAGLIKLVLSLQHGEIPPNLHYNAPNPYIDWQTLALQVVTERTPWPTGRRFASTSSFGISGTNAHVVVEEAPQLEMSAQVQYPLYILPLSAKTDGALAEMAGLYNTYLVRDTVGSLSDICYTAGIGRTHFRHRLAMVAHDRDSMIRQLTNYKLGDSSTGQKGQAPTWEPPKIAFLFTGQGAQYTKMGRELYETQSIFRAALDHCAEILQVYLEKPLLDVIYPAGGEDNTPLLDQTAYTQPALFALEYALAKLWQSWGVTPNVVMGHSVGEYVAACVAGVFSLEDGLKLIAKRGQLMQALPRDGAMVAVRAGEAQVASLLEPFAETVSFAAINGPQSSVISGERQAISTIVEQLSAMGIKTQALVVSHAFHSPLMEPMLTAFEQVARTITYATPRMALVSNLTGQRVGDEVTTPAYWVNHVRQAVRFADGMAAVDQLGCNVLIEIGPKPILLGMGQECVASENRAWLPSLRPGRTDWSQMLESLGELYARGVDVDWLGFYQESKQRKVVLPTYPFQRQRYWLPDILQKKRQTGESLRPLIDKMIRSPLVKETLMETVLSAEHLPYLADYRVVDTTVVPAALHLSTVLSGAELLGMTTCRMQEITFPTIRTLRADEAYTMQLILTPQEDGPRNLSASFQLISLAATGEEQPLIHTTGCVTQQNDNMIPTIDLAILQARCTETMASDEFYTATSTQGVERGPALHWVETVQRGAGEALGKLVMPESVGKLDGYWLHPGLLDACFQLCAATCTSQPELWLPAGVETIEVGPSIAGRHWWCHVEQIGDQCWNIRLFDETGQGVAVFYGLQMRLAPPALRLRRQLTEWLYYIDWQSQPLTTQAIADEPGCWLMLLDEETETGDALVAALQARGQHCIRVTRGTTYASVCAGRVVVNPYELADFQRLVAEHVMTDQLPCRGVVYLWGTEAARAATDGPQVARLLSTGALHLVQALASTGLAPRLWLVTRSGRAVYGAESVAVAPAALWGLGRTIALEHPEFQCTCVDLGASDNNQEEVAALLTELGAAEQETQIALRGGNRYVARVKHYANTPSLNPVFAGVLQPDGSYLILDGLSRLGLETARYVVDQGARHLVLAGNGDGHIAQVQSAVDAMEATGTRVTLIQTDVTRREEIEKLLQACQAQAPLRGIIHLMDGLQDGWLQQHTMDHFAWTFSPKVQSAWHLHKLTQTLPLDFFVCFSSVASMLGSVAQGNQATANAFLDALMQQRRSQGLVGLSINWGPWTDIDETSARDNYPIGMEKIAPAEGLLLLSELLTTANRAALAQVGVLRVDWPEYRKQWPVAGAPPLIRSLLKDEEQMKSARTIHVLQELRESSPAEREPLLQIYLQQQLVQVMGLEQNHVPSPQQPWLEMGLDSLMSVELRNRITRELKVMVPIDAIMQGGSTQTIAGLIQAQFNSFSVNGEAHESTQS